MKNVPECFRSFLENIAWEHSHSNGYHEVLDELDALVFNFENALKDFKIKEKK